MNRIFINYRREDALLYADQLQEVLGEHFGPDEVFRDVDTIEMGLDFVDAIDRALSQADVMLVLIGRQWLVSSDGRSRLQDPDDYVRLEVAGGLARANVRVIPVLVGGATMPAAEDLPEDLAPLTRRHAFEMTDTRWRYDRDELVRRLSRVLEADPAGSHQGLAAGRQVPGSNGPHAAPQHRATPAPARESGSAPPSPAAPVPAASHDADAAHARPPTARPSRRWIAAAAAAGLAAIGIALGAFLVLGGDDGPTPTTTAGPSALSVPDVVGRTEEEARTTLEGRGFEISSTLVADSGEAGVVLSQEPAAGAPAEEGDRVELEVSQAPIDALLAMVPSAIRQECQEETSDDFPARAIAKARCLSGGAVAVQYNLFADEGEMTQAFEESLTGVEDSLGRSIPEGSCETDRFAKGPYTVDGTDAGRVFCYVEEGSSWIEWMDTSLLVYSFALRDDMRDDLLYRWWVRAAGPFVPRQ